MRISSPLFVIPASICLLTASTVFADGNVLKRSANNGQLLMEDVPEVSPQVAGAMTRYQNVRSANMAGWSEDGKSIYIGTRFGDLRQLHRVDKPGGARHQLTFLDEPIGGISVQPGGKLIAFTMDTGGSEFAQIFLYDTADGSIRMVSDGQSRNGVLQWREDGRFLAYQSTRRNGRSNDIWVMDIEDPENAKTVMESPDGSWWGPLGFSEDGEQVLVQQYVSITDSRIHLLQLGTGEMKVLAGSAARPSVYIGAEFAKRSKGFFYVTDHNGIFRELAYRGLDDDSVEIRITEDIPWDVSGFTISDDGKRVAFTVNEDGYSKVYLLNPDNYEYRAVSGLPAGISGGLSFSPDGSRLAMTLNTPQTPSDVFVLDLKDDPLQHGELVRWTYSEVGGLDTSDFVIPELVRYPTFDQVNGKAREIPAFVYKPSDNGNGPHPVIISIHGGPEGQFRPAFRSTFQFWLSELGAAVIAPNVRGSVGYGKEYVKLDNGMLREDSVKDIGALLDWIASQPDLDENRVAVIGGSYGGYMVLASAVHYSDKLKAVVDIVGISNFVTFLENTQDYRRDLRRVEYGDERDPQMRAHLEKISPSNHADKIRAPLFVVQGQNDPRVPVTEAEQIVAAVRQQGHKVWYMNALNEGHGYARKENRDLYTQSAVMFFKEFLLGQNVR